MKIYICNYHYWDGDVYDSHSDDYIEKIFDSEEKAKAWIMQSAKDYLDSLIGATKANIEALDRIEAVAGKSELMLEPDVYDIYQDLRDLCVAKEKLCLEQGRHGAQVRYEPDNYDNYCWDYRAYEVE